MECYPRRFQTSAHYNFKCTYLNPTLFLFLPVNNALVTPKVCFGEQIIFQEEGFGAVIKNLLVTYLHTSVSLSTVLPRKRSLNFSLQVSIVPNSQKILSKCLHLEEHSKAECSNKVDLHCPLSAFTLSPCLEGFYPTCFTC